MPKKLEDCVTKVSKKIKPRIKGQTKESAAWAVCESSVMKKGGATSKKGTTKKSTTTKKKTK